MAGPHGSDDAAEPTVRRSSLQPPPAPPAAETTVSRSSLQPPPAASAAEPTVRRSSLRPPAAEATVARRSLRTPPPASAPPPAWAVPPAPAASPGGSVTLDPTALARRVTVRSGRAGMVVDEHGLTFRAFLRKRRMIPWHDIADFEIRYDDPADPSAGGRVVALTRAGRVDLPATRRAMADLRYTLALLAAYRLRAQTAPPQ